MIEKAKAAKSAEELLSLAKESGVEMTADEAATYFAQLNPRAVNSTTTTSTPLPVARVLLSAS